VGENDKGPQIGKYKFTLFIW